MARDAAVFETTSVLKCSEETEKKFELMFVCNKKPMKYVETVSKL